MLDIVRGIKHRGEALARKWGFRSPYDLQLNRGDVAEVLLRSGAEPWFLWSIENRARRGEARVAMKWIKGNLPRDSFIFEAGCGCGANLVWLGSQGYQRLAGADKSASAIVAARGLAKLAGVNVDLWEDDGLAPIRVPSNIDLILAVNWLYYAPTLDIASFLSMYAGGLKVGGLVLLDMVDRSFDCVDNNEYLTDDWPLPEGERRPTQYRIRISVDELSRRAEMVGYRLIYDAPATTVPPRYVAVLRRM